MSTFGYPPGNTPASESGISDPRGSVFTSPVGGGTITQLSVYTRDPPGGSHDIRVAIYADNAGTPGALLAESSSATTVTGSSFAWYNVPISYVFSSAQVLWLIQWPSNANGSDNYDAGATNQQAYAEGGTYPTWLDPANFGGLVDRISAIYATYTAQGSGIMFRGS